MEHTTYYREVACNSTTWAHSEGSLCGCRGTGWWVSQVDTFHKCPFHKPDAPHPEEEVRDQGAPCVGCGSCVDVDGFCLSSGLHQELCNIDWFHVQNQEAREIAALARMTVEETEEIPF